MLRTARRRPLSCAAACARCAVFVEGEPKKLSLREENLLPIEAAAPDVATDEDAFEPTEKARASASGWMHLRSHQRTRHHTCCSTEP